MFIRMIKKLIEFVMETFESVLFMGSLFLVVYLFIAQPNEVKGASMEPNLKTGDRLITYKIAYKFDPIQRGDIIVIHSPRDFNTQYIKRIIGLPGDTLLMTEGKVYINNKKLDEPYLHVETHTWEGWNFQEGVPFTIPQEYIFVMGDNRPNSSDSREFGPIPTIAIVGKAIYRYYPLNKIGSLANPFK